VDESETQHMAPVKERGSQTVKPKEPDGHISRGLTASPVLSAKYAPPHLWTPHFIFPFTGFTGAPSPLPTII
jgi:hypothetical protein